MARRSAGEGSIYRRRDGRWVATLTQGSKRKSWYGSTRKEVALKLQRALLDQQRGKTLGEQMYVEQFFQHWLQQLPATVRSRTSERYEQMIRVHVLPTLGQLLLQKLSPAHLLRLYAEKAAEGLSPTTISLLHIILHRALRDAVLWDLLETNPCDRIPAPKRKHHEFQHLDASASKRFLAVLKGHSLEAFFLLALTSGLRRGELLALKWQDLDWSTGQLHIRRIFTRVPGDHYVEAEPKTRASRRCIQLSVTTLAALQAHRSHQQEEQRQAGDQWHQTQLIFCSALASGQWATPRRSQG